MPFLFYVYGKRIRAKSTFSPAPDIAQDKRRDEEARLGGDGAGAGASENATPSSDVGGAKKEKGEGEGQVPNGDSNGHRLRKEKTVGKTRKEA
jgi:DHA1 family multidrug resistance protein-like MFS transporter